MTCRSQLIIDIAKLCEFLHIEREITFALDMCVCHVVKTGLQLRLVVNDYYIESTTVVCVDCKSEFPKTFFFIFKRRGEREEEITYNNYSMSRKEIIM
jgi:hypothetical protein